MHENLYNATLRSQDFNLQKQDEQRQEDQFYSKRKSMCNHDNILALFIFFEGSPNTEATQHQNHKKFTGPTIVVCLLARSKRSNFLPKLIRPSN